MEEIFAKCTEYIETANVAYTKYADVSRESPHLFGPGRKVLLDNCATCQDKASVKGVGR